MEAKKPLSLAEKISLAKTKNEIKEDRIQEQETLKELDNQNSIRQQQVKKIKKGNSNFATVSESNPTAQQVNSSTSQQLNKSTVQQLNRSTTQQQTFEPDLKPKDLTLIQFRLLFEIYFNRPFKISGANRLGVTEKFEIPYETVRYNIRSLVKKDYISKPFSVVDGKNRGTTCKVNEKKCLPLFGETKIKNTQQVNNSTSQQLNRLIAKS